MRYQGKLVTWKDDQGFGFIAPNGGGAPVFVHVKSFVNRQRRPDWNELVTYELDTDDRRRPRAANVAFVSERRVERSGGGAPSWAATAFAIYFVGIVIGAAAVGTLRPIVLVLYFGASAVAFVAYGIDKSAARKARWRVSESTLHLLGLCGGWPGGLLAQRIFRHKSRKQEFQTTFWATVVLNCIAFAACLYATSARLLP
jgi:uncharacterized membrane protein YsdA (DUF1294 family)/cold shock CspA family protein